MIKVIASKRKIEIIGHAKLAPKGEDIVCSAVSSLVYTTLNSLKGFNKRKEIKVKDGEVTIDIKHKVKKDDQVRLEMLITGLKLIAKKYPEHLIVKEKKI